MAVVIDGIRLDTLVVGLDLERSAIYQPISAARRKIRRALVANG